MGFTILLELYIEFFKIGLFAVGGGLATIPFLQELSDRTNWFTQSELANMIAVSESTPGPIGINMATFVGFETAGISGGIMATLGTITPSLIIIIIISKVLIKFRESLIVQKIFYGLRPASSALIVAAAFQVAEVAFFKETSLGNVLIPSSIALALGIWGLMYYTPFKSYHPFFFLVISCIAGMIFAL